MPQMLWLPPRRHLGALVGRVPALRRLLSTATRLPDAVAGANALLSTVFLECPEFPAVAALTRRVDAPDDHDGRWLRADPCHLRVETAGVRMLACGGLRIPEDELPMFEAALRPLFDDAGWRFHAATPDRWYVQPDPLHPPIGTRSAVLRCCSTGYRAWETVDTGAASPTCTVTGSPRTHGRRASRR